MTNKPRPCCDPTSQVPLWEGTPTGKIINVDGIEAYLSTPTQENREPLETPSKQPKQILLFLTEVHGIHLPNSQLLADAFASHLHIPVLMPDQLAGQNRIPQDMDPQLPSDATRIPWTEDKNDPNFENRGLRLPTRINTETSDAWPFAKPPGWNERGREEFTTWIQRHGPEVTDPILERVAKHCRATYGDNVKIGAVGYCFGGRYVMRLMARGVVDVGVVNHPSFFTMGEVRALSEGKRLALFAAETDEILPREKRRKMEDVLADSGAKWMSTVYGGTEHGFSVRGDLSVREVRLAKEMALKGAVEWFGEWLCARDSISQEKL